MRGETSRLRIDIPTLIALAALAWILVNVSHEIVGHAGSAALLGMPINAVSTTTADIQWVQGLPAGAYSTFYAAGTLVNLLGGAAALALLRWGRRAHAATRTFLWLFATFSLVIVTMNLVSASLIGAGDWTEFSRHLEHQDVWRAVIMGVGLIITIGGYVMPLRTFLPDLRDHRRAQLTLTVIPVVTLMVVQSLSLIGSPFVRLPSAANHLLACVFAYLHFVLWAILVNALPAPRSRHPAESIQLPRSRGWLAIGLVLVLLYLVVLGPGVGSA